MSGISPRGGRLNGDFFLIPCNFVAIPNTTEVFTAPFGYTYIATEADTDATVDFPFLLRRLRVVINSNTVTGNTVVKFRQNAATIASVTVATTVVGDAATGILSRMIQAGDTIGFSLTVTDGAANSVSGCAYAICQRVTE